MITLSATAAASTSQIQAQMTSQRCSHHTTHTDAAYKTPQHAAYIDHTAKALPALHLTLTYCHHRRT